MTDEKKTFSVKDRRLFTPEGEVRRPENAAEGPAEGASGPEAAAPAAADPERAPGSAEPRARVPDSADEATSDVPVDFAGFLFSLAAQGLQALSGDEPRLQEARAMVSILEMLKDKTEGRRTPPENELLDTLLYQLRMGYLERHRAGGA